MKKFYATVPIAGSICMEIEAENEKEAKQKALNADWTVDLQSTDGVHLNELETLERIVQGNICYAPQWEIELEEVD